MVYVVKVDVNQPDNPITNSSQVKVIPVNRIAQPYKDNLAGEINGHFLLKVHGDFPLLMHRFQCNMVGNEMSRLKENLKILFRDILI